MLITIALVVDEEIARYQVVLGRIQLSLFCSETQLYSLLKGWEGVIFSIRPPIEFQIIL
jgi:hypothetical protein